MKPLCLLAFTAGCFFEVAMLLLFSIAAFALCRDDVIGPAWREAIDNRKIDLAEILNPTTPP